MTFGISHTWLAQRSCCLRLAELSGRGRAWLVALYFALACASRFTVILTLPIFCFWLTRGFAVAKQDRRALVAAVLTWLPFVALWVAYNEVRWHVPWDSGHTIFFHQDVNIGSPVGSPFALSNLPYELGSFFVQGLQFSAQAPYVVPPPTGVALTWTSPALLLACFVRRPLPLVVSSWAAALLAALPSLVYYANGTEQFGMRHALDFEAFLFVLMTLAARRGLATVWRALITFSAGMGLWGAWFWNAFYRSWM